MEINNFEIVSGLRFAVMNCLDLFNYSITAVEKQYFYAIFLIHPWRIIHSTMGRVDLGGGSRAELGAKSGEKGNTAEFFSNSAVH